MVNKHSWSHLFNLCSSFNDKSTLLDPGIGVLLAPPHTENGTKHTLSIQTNSKLKQFTLKPAYVQSSGAPHGLQACTAEQWEGPFHGRWMLFETQSENLGRQVNVPISHVLLYKLIHHPVEKQQAVKHQKWHFSISDSRLRTCRSAAASSDLRCPSAGGGQPAPRWSSAALSVLCWSTRRIVYTELTWQNQPLGIVIAETQITMNPPPTSNHGDPGRCSHSQWCYTHLLDDVMRQPGQDSERESKMCDHVHDVLGHARRQAGLHGHGFHPLREVVGHAQDVSVTVERLRQRPSDVQPEPLPRRRHLPTRSSSVRTPQR